tara:strand:+ start:171 stop:1370 length:1200 start_codon:yes stop_codon:yes gene_type:complete
MSTTITDDQTLRNVAATLHSASTDNGNKLQASAQKLLHSISLDKRNASPTVDDIHVALRERNLRSIEENYPHLEEHLALAKSQPMSPVDVERDSIPLSNVDGLLFFSQQLGRIEQGLFGEQFSDLEGSIEELSEALSFRLAVLNTLDYNAQPTPDIRDIVDKVSQLGAHGDYLYGLQNGFRTLIAQLELAASSPGMHFGDDIFIAMLDQAYKSGPIVVPTGASKFDTSVRHSLRNPNYNITSDVPMPNQSVADDVSRAMAFLAHRLDVVDLLDTDGNKVDPSTKENIKKVFLSTASSMILRSNHLRFEDYAGLEGGDRRRSGPGNGNRELRKWLSGRRCQRRPPGRLRGHSGWQQKACRRHPLPGIRKRVNLRATHGDDRRCCETCRGDCQTAQCRRRH